ncbi:putative RNA-dependent RNA polymerase [Sophora japonica powdery mildew-associated partitivirus]|uniref:putative RNA-dependent RNA polymerase n=1 Tax=Sophora japonica powdery mildew-associated partitivirus TaxID=1891704 RepID=UPI0008482777|nr:putative RNA-dependent RNA polymerase [Sophora japonica powdery mildew-associated partitivirus]AOF47283.1 putative RNA-dependent RNA polymerase [Sophora japonica powdery mildew-associated partitivirus]
MASTNLLRLGKIPRSKKHNDPLSRSLRINRIRQGIIKRAIYKICPINLARQVIFGFKRSEGSDDVAETDFLRSDVPYFDMKRDFHYLRALRVCERLFRPSRTLHPIAFPDLRFYPWSLSVSAEAPFSVEKKRSTLIRSRQSDGEDLDGRLTFHNLYNEIFELNRNLIHQIKEGDKSFWNKDGTPRPYWYNTLHTRPHLVKSSEPDKLRAVFGVPKLLLMAENMFIWSLQKEYLNQKIQSPMLWGFETFKGGWLKIWNRMYSKKCSTFLSADWSGFDRFALFECVDDIHRMWRNWFDFSKYEPTIAESGPPGIQLSYPKSKTNPQKIERLWNWMCYCSKYTPIKGQSGQLYQWQYNGIASGYQQTQLIGSFVNSIYMLTCLSDLGINIESDNFQLFVQGDDSLTEFSEIIQKDDLPKFLTNLAKVAKSRFNANLSVQKTTAGESLNDVEVLSYNNTYGIAFRDEAELLAHLLYPERFQTLEATVSCCIGIAYASMGCSQYVDDTCLDAYNFLTTQFKVKPDSNFLQDFFRIRGSPLTDDFHNPRFPTKDECFNQNYEVRSRSDSEKQRLWPSIPTGDYGFHFINE